jgi:hypothetical protein
MQNHCLRLQYMRPLIIVSLIAACLAVTSLPTFAQEDSKQKTEVDAFRKTNRIRSLAVDIGIKKKEVEERYAKKKVSREYDEKTKQMIEKPIVDLKQPMVYEKGMLLFEERFKQYNDETDTDKKIAAGESALKTLAKMVEIFGTDTEKLEKSLKKAKNSAQIAQLLGV